MTHELKVTIGIEPGAFSLLEKFVQAFTGSLSSTPAKTVKSGKNKELQEAEIVPTAGGTPAAPLTAPTPAAGKAVTVEQIRALAAVKRDEGKKEGIRKLLADHEVKDITTLKEEHYSSFFEQLSAL